MDNIHRNFNELKSIVKSPRAYGVNYFDDIRSEISYQCKIYLSRPNLDKKDIKIAIRQHKNMIATVDALKKQCILDTENFKVRNSDKLDLEVIEHDLKNFQHLFENEEILQIEKKIFCLSFELKKYLLNKKCVFFFSSRNFQRFLETPNASKNDKEPENSNIRFGNLVIVDDDYLQHSNIEQIDLASDWCHDFLKLSLLKDQIRENSNDGKDISVVSHISINLRKKKRNKFKPQVHFNSSL